MLNSTFLEVTIGLAVTYFMCSLLCSGLNELVCGQILRWRSSELEAALRRVLDDPENPGFANEVLGHSLVEALRTPASWWLYFWAGEKKWRQQTEFPSYLPAGIFVTALLDELSRRVPPTAPVLAPAPAPPPAAAFPGMALGGPGVTEWRQVLAASVPAFQPGSLKPVPADLARILDALLSSTTPTQDARARLEQWFNDMMDRLSGHYRRLIRAMLVLWATGLVLAFNLDTIRLIKHFETQPAVLNALVQAAPQIIRSYATNTVPSESDGRRLTTEIAADLFNFDLPLGWTKDEWSRITASGTGFLHKLAGLLLSIAAIALGSPFWFDVLNKLANLRAGGKQPVPSAPPPTLPPVAPAKP